MTMHLRIIPFFSFIFCLNVAMAQQDTSVWNSTKYIEHNELRSEIPQAWKEVKLTDNAESIFKFELTGIGIQGMFNSSPVTAFYTIQETQKNTVPEIIEEKLADFLVLIDKVQEPGYVYDSSSITIKSGEGATYVHTRYYRRNKASNYSRYMMIVQNPKTQKYFVATFWFQYKSPLYDIERALFFKEYAERAFSRFMFR